MANEKKPTGQEILYKFSPAIMMLSVLLGLTAVGVYFHNTTK